MTLLFHEGWYEENSMKWRQGKQDLSKVKELLAVPQATSSGIVCLQDQEYQFRVKPDERWWNVYGSPWTLVTKTHGHLITNKSIQPNSVPHFPNRHPVCPASSFMFKRIFLEFSFLPATTNSLTHGPPYKHLDILHSGDPAGCKALRPRVEDLQHALHVFGHIHGAHGAMIH